MTTTLTRDVYRTLIQEDLEWLESVPRTLERDHVISIVKASEAHEYGAYSLGHELTATKLKLASAEARVKELEGLAIGNESEGDGGRWFEVFIPTERIGGANCEGEECPTLGDAMPRKDS